MVVFMDDLNMIEPDEYGSHPPLELLREFMDHGGLYDVKRLQWTDVFDATVVATSGPQNGGRYSINPRVLRHFK